MLVGLLPYARGLDLIEQRWLSGLGLAGQHGLLRLAQQAAVEHGHHLAEERLIVGDDGEAGRRVMCRCPGPAGGGRAPP